ncbi:MAG TPA: 3-hydroxyacyl-CoA dehydrogenase NAD-binding domain-containing protein, partial [Streptosporangiaceae bacterium]
MSELEGPGPRDPRVAVIGAGLMGAGIAQVFLAAGVPVAVYDPAPAALDALPARISAGLDLLGLSNDCFAGLLHPGTSLPGAVTQADLVIEAAPEQLEVKRRIFAELDDAAPAGAVAGANVGLTDIDPDALKE